MGPVARTITSIPLPSWPRCSLRVLAFVFLAVLLTGCGTGFNSRRMVNDLSLCK